MILPSSMTRESRRAVVKDGLTHEPIYCANCGKEGGESIRAPGNFLFWLCDPCSEKWEPMVGVSMIPNDVMRQRIVDVQLEEYGRHLAPSEVMDALSDVNSPLSKLARDLPR